MPADDSVFAPAVTASTAPVSGSDGPEPVIWVSSLGDGPGLLPMLGLGLELAAAVGGGGGAAAIPKLVCIAGNFVAGPVVTGHQLVAKAYDANGNELAQGIIKPDGTFELNLGSFTGLVLVKVTDGDSGADYWDEATGAPKDLAIDELRAVTYVNGGGAAAVAAAVTALGVLAQVLAAEGDQGQARRLMELELAPGLEPMRAALGDLVEAQGRAKSRRSV